MNSVIAYGREENDVSIDTVIYRTFLFALLSLDVLSSAITVDSGYGSRSGEGKYGRLAGIDWWGGWSRMRNGGREALL